ncbi:hypothetical protein AX15_005938 [Amanita polypyramis BW_CC]|nr:hypothetical protein AX15_005938 [Amanita polypyramis BW_CC]
MAVSAEINRLSPLELAFPLGSPIQTDIGKLVIRSITELELSPKMIRTGALLILISSLVATSFSSAIIQERQPEVACVTLPSAPSSCDFVAAVRRASDELEGVVVERAVAKGAMEAAVAHQENEESAASAASQETSKFAEAAAAKNEQVTEAAQEITKAATVTEAQAEEEAKEITLSNDVAESRISNDLDIIANYAAALDKYITIVLKTRKLTIAQGLAIQRQMVTLTTSLTRTIKVVEAARPLTPSQSVQLVPSVLELQREFVQLLDSTVAAKTVFKSLPFNIVPLVATALRTLGSSTDLLEADLQFIVVGTAKRDVATSRRVIAAAFARAIATYSR